MKRVANSVAFVALPGSQARQSRAIPFSLPWQVRRAPMREAPPAHLPSALPSILAPMGVGPLRDHIFMNAEYNQWFEEVSRDSVLRRAAIAQFTRQRTILVCCASVSTVAALVSFLTPVGPLLVFVAASMWFGVGRIKSRRQVLLLLDKKPEQDATPAA